MLENDYYKPGDDIKAFILVLVIVLLVLFLMSKCTDEPKSNEEVNNTIQSETNVELKDNSINDSY